jgi:signal transduction histidine kinase
MVTDITDRKRAEDALRRAHRQLSLMSNITRHDILNKITATLGYLQIAMTGTQDPATREYLRKIESAIEDIRTLAGFTQVYQDLGSQDPLWQGLDAILPWQQLPPVITMEADVRGVEIFADPMMEKVFYNLLDNSIRHGKHVTTIAVTYSRPDAGLIISWEDNGAGIAAVDKEKIFEPGFGRRTGIGLFLIREILSLTGIVIRETGIEGKGARFEILVPEGMYRVPASSPSMAAERKQFP